MIFVTLGNQNFQFNRLLEKVENLVKLGVIKSNVIAQIGHTVFKSDFIDTIDFLSKEEFDDYIEKSNVVISHAGTGSLISAIRKEKKVISASRLKKYNEHIDNHQTEILEAFSSKNYIIALKEDLSDMEEKVVLINQFIPEKFISNNKLFNNDLCGIIENLIIKNK